MTSETSGRISYTESNVFKSITSLLWNTTECCRGFEDMKDEINMRSSPITSDILV